MMEMITWTCALLVITSGYLQLEIDEEINTSALRASGFPKTGDIPLLNRKIFKGQRVFIREHPYMVSIRRRVSHYLTGVLLTTNVVLTVAHPLKNVPVTDLSIVLGENYSDRGTRMRSVLVVVIHEDFDPYTLINDIAMLRIYEDVHAKTSVKWIQLSVPNAALKGTAFVTGWGRCDNMGTELCLDRTSKYYPNEKMDPMLRTVTFPVGIKSNYCQAYTDHDLNLSRGMLCVGLAREQDKVSPCLGVPGAVMVNKARLLGLLSWGFGCGYSHDLPLVYTDVRFYIPWITDNVTRMSKISMNNLTELFDANKAAQFVEWIMKTRINAPKLMIRKDKHLTALQIDYELVKLIGTKYDVRDFIMNGRYHEDKQNMYKYIKEYIDSTTKPSKFFTYTTNSRAEPHIGSATLESIGFNTNDIVANDGLYEILSLSGKMRDSIYVGDD